jgi:hypothetical protein
MSSTHTVNLDTLNIDNNTDSSECPICYEVIDTKNNNCITPCGHEFCFKCLMKSISRNNKCPCCRSELQELNIESDSESVTTSTYESDDEYDSDSDEDESREAECDVEKIMDTLLEKGFTMIDFVSIIIDRFPKRDPKYTSQFCEELSDRFYKHIEVMDEEVTRELRETETMASEDKLLGIDGIPANRLPEFDAIRLNLLPAFNMADSNLQPFVVSNPEIPITEFKEPTGSYSFI